MTSDSQNTPEQAPAPHLQATARAQSPSPLRRQLERAIRLQGASRWEEAFKAYRSILEEDPLVPSAWINMGVLLRRMGHRPAAVAALKRGVALKPYDGPAWSNLGNALRADGRYDEAVRAHARALELASGSPQIHYNMALAQRDLGYLDAALHAFRRAEMLGYNKPELLWDRALTQLLQGDLQAGFENYENRWSLASASKPASTAPPLDINAPPPAGPVLVWSEQGFGDTLHFSRYVLMLKEKGFDKIIFAVQGPLARLFQQSDSFQGITVVARGTPYPEPAAQIALLSLPHAFETTLDALPNTTPYIAPAASAAPPSFADGVLNVGICWAGKPSHRNDRNRSVGAAGFIELLDQPGASFHTLQKGTGALQIADEGLDALVSNPSARLKDFADTAAFMSGLDLVITVDTAIAHLAGALGKPTWVLLPYAPDWRWMLHSDDSPWYPTMTLFRQSSPGDWDEVFARVRTLLARHISDKIKAGDQNPNA